jgi:hypothetical protein
MPAPQAPVVPIETLAPAPAPAPAPARTVRAAEAVPPPETADLIGSWMLYERMAGAGIGAPSLQELLAPASAAPPPAASVRGASRSGAGGGAGDTAAVDVRTLLYRGDRALKRAQELRQAAKQVSGDALRALVDEVCDLVALALEPPPSP